MRQIGVAERAGSRCDGGPDDRRALPGRERPVSANVSGTMEGLFFQVIY